MPLRAVGYVASAVVLQKAHLPKATVQVVHTLHTAQRVNGLDIEATRKQARRFADATSQLLGDLTVQHAVDPLQPIEVDHEQVAEILESLPDHAREKFAHASQDRGSLVEYVAAHLQMHDTATKLAPLRSVDDKPVVPERIISVGAQSERPFYLARMACRESGLAIPERVDQTAQIFTRHVLPPYYACREGEPHIDQLTFGLDELEATAVTHPNPSVARDLQYVADFVRSVRAEEAA